MSTEKKGEVLQCMELPDWVRARPDTFVGAVEAEPELRWVVGKRSQLASLKPIISKPMDAKLRRLLGKELRVEPSFVAPEEEGEAAEADPVPRDGESCADEEETPSPAKKAKAAPKLSLKECCAAYMVLEVSPAAEKIVDEILTNALDRQHKDDTMTKIEVSIDPIAGMVTVTNNGKGMSVTKPERTRPDIPDEYWPTILCTRSMTGGNFSNEGAHYQGGRNGIGMKATSILSSWFKMDVGDPENKKHFVQEWRNGLKETDGPVIKAYRAKTGYVRVSFKPDMAYFKQDGPGFNESFTAAIRSRVWELTAVADSHISIWLDGDRLPVKNLTQFVSLFTPSAGRPIRGVHEAGGRALWDCTLVPLKSGMTHGIVAFVNGIRCDEGKHVNFLLSKVADILQPAVALKTKHAVTDVSEAQVRKSMFAVLSIWVDGPRFKSQSKDALDTPVKDWGFKWVPDEDFQKRVISTFVDMVSARIISGSMDDAIKESAKSTGGRRSVNIPKYEHAAEAGKANTEASLILTEGDSAKGLAMAGRSLPGAAGKYGVFPLKGVPLNCRGMDIGAIAENVVLANVAKILGLEYGRPFKDATDLKRLNYKYLVLLADQDFDGGHIVGLVVNWIQYCWPSLLALRPDFIKRFATPLIIATRKRKASGENPEKFLSIPSFKQWLTEDPARKTAYDFAYYKGLGGHSNKQGREYFKEYTDYTVTIGYEREQDMDSLENFFNKKRTDIRKKLIREYDEDSSLDYTQTTVTTTDFLMTEMLGYCHDNVPRSIPGLDGCKRTQRKLLWSCRDIMAPGKASKLTDLAMKCGERSKYHHGETSLYQTMVGMAQSHPGTNNINLFINETQMGDRLHPRDTFSAPRYLFTGPHTILTHLVRKEDDPILTYRIEDGKVAVEPVNFFPVVPLDLLNGSNGVASGWSTNIPPFHPSDVINAFKMCIMNAEGWRVTVNKMMPWFDGLSGPVVDTETSWVSYGLYSVETVSDTIVDITLLDLPYGTWTDEYQTNVLSKYLIRKDGDETKGFIAKLQSGATDARVDYTLTCDRKLLEKALGGTLESKRGEAFPKDTRGFRITADVSVTEQARAFYAKNPCRYPKLEDLLKLTDTMAKTNMVRLNAHSKPEHYPNLSSIVEMYAALRLAAYADRIEYQINNLQRQLMKEGNKLKYVKEIIAQTFRPNDYEETADMWEELQARGYLEDTNPMICKMAAKTVSDLPMGEEAQESKNTFHYLTDMGDGSKTRGACKRLENEMQKLQTEINGLAFLTPSGVWLKELDELQEAYNVFADKRAEANHVDQDGSNEKKKKKRVVSRKLAAPKKTSLVSVRKS